MVVYLEIFKSLYLCSLTSYGPMTGLADFSFTKRCYLYLQSALNPCIKLLRYRSKSLISVIFFFFFSSFFIKTSYPCPIKASWVSFFTVLHRLGRGCAMTGSKEDIFCWWISWLWQWVALWICMNTIKHSNNAASCSLHKKGAFTVNYSTI